VARVSAEPAKTVTGQNGLKTPKVKMVSIVDLQWYNNTIQYNIRLLEAVRTQQRTIIEREKYVENENVKMVHNE